LLFSFAPSLPLLCHSLWKHIEIFPNQSFVFSVLPRSVQSCQSCSILWEVQTSPKFSRLLPLPLSLHRLSQYLFLCISYSAFLFLYKLQQFYFFNQQSEIIIS